LRVLYEELKCATIAKWEIAIAVSEGQKKCFYSMCIQSIV